MITIALIKDDFTWEPKKLRIKNRLHMSGDYDIEIYAYLGYELSKGVVGFEHIPDKFLKDLHFLPKKRIYE